MRALVLYVFAAVFVAASASASISGIVVGADGAPISGATISAFPQATTQELIARIGSAKPEREPLGSTTSGNGGRFQVATGGRSVVELVVSAAGHEYVAFDASDNDDVGTLLLRDAKPVSGRVTAGGKPVAGAVVLTADGAFVTRTDAEGRYSLPRGDTRVVAVHADYVPLERPVGTDKSVDLALERGVEIRGRVIAPNGHAPVAGATILAGSWSVATSGEDGSFLVAHAPARWKAIRVASPQGGSTVTNVGAKTYDVHLRKPGSFSGSVRDVKTNAPVAGVRMRLALLDNAAISESAITNAKGEFAFRGLAPGRYDVGGSHPLYLLDGNVMEALGVGEDDTYAATATLRATIRGRITDEAKQPVSGVAVMTGGGWVFGTRLGNSAPDGTFVARVPAAPLVELSFAREGYAPAATQVSAAAGETKTIAVTLTRGARLPITVVDADGKPVADAMVRFESMPRRTGPPAFASACGARPCKTGSDGKVEARLSAGSYGVTVDGEAIVAKKLGAMTIDERTPPLTVTVERGVEVSGRVAYADGEAVPDAMVMLASPGDTSVTRSDAGGNFSLHNAVAGKVMVHAETPARLASEPTEVVAPATNVIVKVPRGGRITGRVTDAASHSPLTDFNVYILPKNSGGRMRPATPIQTDDGSFVLDAVTPGTVSLRIVAIGYAATTVAGIEVEEAKSASAGELTMERAARLTGHITTSTGQPIGGATIFIVEVRDQMRTPTPSDRAASDATGEYALATVPPGERVVRIEKQGFVAQEKSIEAVSGKEIRLDVTLDRGREIAGRVVDESGQGVAGADVFAQGGAESFAHAQSDADGGFRLSGLADGVVKMRAVKPDFVNALLDVQQGNGQNVTLVLRRGATINGRVTGLPANRMTDVFINAHSTTGAHAAARVNADGTFTLRGLPDGSVMVSASRRSSTGAVDGVQREIEIVNGVAPQVELAFTESIVVRGRVTLRGRPLPDVWLNFVQVPRGTSTVSTRTSADGAYTASVAAAGDYEITARAPSGAAFLTERRTVTASAPQDFEVRAAMLRGRVVDARTTAPLAEAAVQLLPLDAPNGSGFDTVSDSEGRFVFDIVTAGRWRVSAQKATYERADREVLVADSAADVELRLSTGVLSTFRFVDAATGEPVAAYFSIDASGRRELFNDVARADGSARAWVPAGHQLLTFGGPGYGQGELEFDAPAHELRVSMVHGGTLIVSGVREGMRVAVASGKQKASSSLGRFEGLAPGEYVVQLLDGSNKEVDRRTATVRSRETTTVSFE